MVVLIPVQPSLNTRFLYRSLTHVGDHVDILGRSSLNDLILRVAGGKGDQIKENYVSNIREYSENVKIYEEDDISEGEVEEHQGL